MEFKIEDGSNLLSIEDSGACSFFRFEAPLSVVWEGDAGTSGKYFCLLPYSKSYRDELHQKLIAALNTDFSDNTEQLYELLKPLFHLFKNGDYTLEYYSSDNKRFFKYQTQEGTLTGDIFWPLDIVFGPVTDISQAEMLKKETEDALKSSRTDKQYFDRHIISKTTIWIYDGDESFYATQPRAIINEERVKYFEELIDAGERPFAIIMCAGNGYPDVGSHFYILDGHHKLLAYQKKNVYPSLAVITCRSASDFDAEKLATILYPAQVRNILNTWHGKDSYLEEKLKNPDSPLHKFIKNGLVREYHENGIIKHEAFYINDKVDGKSLHWYDNGQLKNEHYYNKGRRTGTWKDYFPSGNIQFVQPFDDKGSYNGDIISYYDNGRIRIKQTWTGFRNADGVSYQSWYEDGEKEAELTYLDGKIVDRKSWPQPQRNTNYDILKANYEHALKNAYKHTGLLN